MILPPFYDYIIFYKPMSILKQNLYQKHQFYIIFSIENVFGLNYNLNENKRKAE